MKIKFFDSFTIERIKKALQIFYENLTFMYNNLCNLHNINILKDSAS